jgi:hypothetical protein
MKKYFLIIFLGFNIAGLTQNVGIGTPTPLSPLHVKSASFSNVLRIEGNTPYLSLYDITDGYRGYLWYTGSNVQLGSAFASGVPLTIAPNQTVSTTFLTNGNVGIGTSTPSEKLEVAGNIEASGSVKGASLTFNSPKTYYYSLCGSDIIQKSYADQVERETTAGGGVYIVGGSGSLTAPLHLPHGATVTKMTVYFVDNSPINLSVILPNSSAAQMATITSSGTPGETSLFDNTINTAVIDNSLYAYTIDISSVGGPWPDVSMIVRRIIFEYTVSSL